MTLQISNSPVMALYPDTRLVAGVERQEDDSVRVYVDSRHLNEYFTIDPSEYADRVEQAWKASSGSHLFLREIKDDECET
jgi:hypothetical protein